MRRHKGLVAGTAATAVALVLGLVLALWLAHSAQRARERADANAEETRRAAARADVHAASANLDHNAVVPARIHLERVPPDLRGWEWRLLAARLDLSRVHVAAEWDAPSLPCLAPDLASFAGLEGKRLLRLAAVDGRVLEEAPADVRQAHPVHGPEGRLLLVGMPEQRVQVTDALTGEVLARDEEAWPGGITAVAAHPDGRVAVALHGDRGHARIVVADATSGAIARFQGDPVETAVLAWSPAGDRLAGGGGWGTAIWVHHVAARCRVALLEGHHQDRKSVV